MYEEKFYSLALSFVNGIGDINAKKLIEYFGSAKNIFNLSLKELKNIPGIGEHTAKNIFTSMNPAIERAIEEEEYCITNDINYVGFTDNEYPQRLTECPDAPIVIFYKGNSEFNKQKIISIVGTRNATNYGIEFTETIVQSIKESFPDCVIVSGLAYGIDVCAHKAALKNELETWAILGHSLKFIYPTPHLKVANNIIESNGLLISDYHHKSKIDPANFAKRNRIIAGISDAVIVVESGIKGGAIITANIANHYNRDVFALPGNINSNYSKGCNLLIKTNRANLIESIEDIKYILNWNSDKQEKVQQKIIFQESLNDNEIKIVNVLKNYEFLDIDNISRQTGLNSDILSLSLLELEFKGIIKPLPGKIFTLKI